MCSRVLPECPVSKFPRELGFGGVLGVKTTDLSTFASKKGNLQPSQPQGSANKTYTTSTHIKTGEGGDKKNAHTVYNATTTTHYSGGIKKTPTPTKIEPRGGGS